jgi:hypothetical protein
MTTTLIDLINKYGTNNVVSYEDNNNYNQTTNGVEHCSHTFSIWVGVRIQDSIHYYLGNGRNIHRPSAKDEAEQNLLYIGEKLNYHPRQVAEIKYLFNMLDSTNHRKNNVLFLDNYRSKL